MRFNLSFLDRITIRKLLPKEGNYITNKIVRDLTNELEFTAEEISACNIRMKDGLILWDIERDKDVEVNEVVEYSIKNKLKELDSSNKLPIEYNPLFEKFKLNN